MLTYNPKNPTYSYRDPRALHPRPAVSTNKKTYGPSGYTKQSHVWRISVRTQAEVAEELEISVQAVQKQEARAMAALRKALVADPAALSALAPDLAQKHLSPGGTAFGRTPAEQRLVFGGHFITRDQRAELEHFHKLAEAYDADGQGSIAAEIRSEIVRLEGEIRKIPVTQ